jgi:acetylornithine deacetylase/succinyl-diaminopimelate desuccinylase-like protein
MDAFAFARANRPRFLGELEEFLRIPSVSTQPEHQPDMLDAANWLRDQLLAVGFPRAEILPTAGHPIVFAEWSCRRPAAPTVLLYGHYDVQPADPLELWRTPPFEPVVVGDDLYARGASDDKGQLLAQIKAVESLSATAGEPPVSIRCLFEGEEESGSEHLDDFVTANRSILQADVALISDSSILSKDQPSIIYAVRGITYVEVEVTGPAGDLHSGRYGGAVHNPIHALAEMIAGLHDSQGRITIPGFYDRVQVLTPAERAGLARLPFDRHAWLREAGITTDWGEPEYSIVERTTARPTLDVNGIWGGYTQPGAKTVLPSKAFAKISMRLVPQQDPAEISRLIQDHFQAIAPPAVTVQVRELHHGQGAIVPLDSPAIQAAARAYAESFGAEPLFVREGGSLPVVATLRRELGIDSILMGFGLPDDNLHAPNEKLHLPNYFRGIDTVIRFLSYLA